MFQLIFINQSGIYHQLQQFQWYKTWFSKHDLLQNMISSKITKTMKLANNYIWYIILLKVEMIQLSFAKIDWPQIIKLHKILFDSIHRQAKQVTLGVSSWGAISKICQSQFFFYLGGTSLGIFAIFKLSALMLGGGTYFIQGIVHFYFGVSGGGGL